MIKSYISAGSNIGNRLDYLEKAQQYLKKEKNITFLRSSSIVETKAWGNTNQADFLNAVFEIETELSAYELWDKCLGIEKKLGRIRNEKKWQPRTVDLDIIFYGDMILEGELTVPHKHAHQRDFVLKPMAELDGDFIHPVLKKTINELCLKLP